MKMQPQKVRVCVPKQTMTIKIVLLGNYSVGKTSIIKQMARRNTVIVKDEFDFEKPISGTNTQSDSYRQEKRPSPHRKLYTVFEENPSEVRKEMASPAKFSSLKRDHDPTLFSYMCRPGVVEVEFQHNDATVRALIADTGGQEKYRSLTRSYYRGAHGCLLVFDVTNEESFESLNGWLEEMNSYKSFSELPLILVGTQCSLRKRCVSEERAANFASEHSCDYMEVELQNMDDIQRVFERLVNDILSCAHSNQTAFNSSIHLKPVIKVQKQCPCS